MSGILFATSVLSILFAVCHCTNVTLSDGTVVAGRAVDSKTEAFLGIPYAQAPIGQLRFRLPMKPKPQRFIDATKYGHRCPQFNPAIIDVGGVLENEDCLFLNVFRPVNAEERGKVPVLVFIHGGAFESGSAARYPPSNLSSSIVSRGVILMTLQYRLNVFGFAFAEEEIPANAGLYDQLLALQWVRKNVAAFGGDPHRVTLAGQSAGAASVSSHLHSALSNDLFHQAILMSGNIRNSWAVAGSFGSTDFAATERVGLATGCLTQQQLEEGTAQGLAECLRALSWRELQKVAQTAVQEGQSCCAWAPRRDGYILPQETAQDFALEHRRNMPILIGNTREESFDTIINIVDKGELTKAEIDRKKFEYVVERYSKHAPERSREEFANLLRSSYSEADWADDDNDRWIHAISQLMTGVSFTSGTAAEARTLAEFSDSVRLYSFDFASERSGFPWPLGVRAAFHSWDVDLLFRLSTAPPAKRNFTYSPADSLVSGRLADLFTSFVITGLPTAGGVTQWDPLRADNPSVYLSVDLHSALRSDFHAKADQIWNTVLPRMLQKP